MSLEDLDPDTRQQVVDNFLAFYRRHAQPALADLAAEFPHETTSVTIDWSGLSRYNHNLAEDVLDRPRMLTQLAEEAIADYDFPVPMDLTPSDVTVRFKNLPDGNRHTVGKTSPTEHNGDLRAMRGQVTKVTEPKAKVEEAAFECQRCGTLTRIPQSGEDFQEPHECAGCERQGPFQLNFDESEFVDQQNIRLKTPPADVGEDGSGSFDVAAEGDVVGSVRPGEEVEATVRVTLRQERNGQSKQPTFEAYGRAHAFEHLDRDIDPVQIQKHREEFEQIAESGEAMEEITASVAPGIYGYDTIKKAIALQLFGGTWKQLPDGSTRRGSSHILLCGDPGLGKTQLIDYACKLAPRSVYTSGEGSTKAGLTAASIQDDFGDGGWTIQAGALVQANNGLAGIDELDKMRDGDREGLHTVMESGKVTKTAAGGDGQSVTLPARTTILAGANPEQGRFNDHQNAAEQINLPAPLFSRFDLVFTMTDDQDEEFDSKLSEHMMRSSRAGQKLERGEELDHEDSQTEPTIDDEVLRAYIAYARQEIVPVLSDDALEVIKARYKKIRQANDDDGPVPITARKIDAMVRLAEARARIRLSDTITAADAEEVCDLVETALYGVGVDAETGELDADIMETGTSKSMRQRINGTLAIIKDRSEPRGDAAHIDEVRELFEKRGFQGSKFAATIQKLKDNGDIYEAGTDKFRPLNQ